MRGTRNEVAVDKITQELGNFIVSFSEKEMSPILWDATENYLVDTLGCAAAAHNCRTAQMGLALAPSNPREMTGSILFHRQTTSLEAAAFVNACMIRALDFNDRYPGGHPSDCLGAILALAFSQKVSGQKLLNAMAVTYEIFARLSDGAMLSRRGWDQGFVVGLSTIGGLCRLLNMPIEQVGSAIGMFASTGVPLRVTRAGELSEWKNVATPYAVKNATYLTLLARQGMEGPGRPFEGRNGLFENITGAFELAPFPTAGGIIMTPRVQMKFWPVETNAQPVVWAGLELRSQVHNQDIDSIEAFTNKFTVYEIASEPQKWDPQSRETADHSLPYILARTIVDGPLTEEAFTLQAVRDPDLRPLMDKIRVSVDPRIDALPTGQVEFRLVAANKRGERIEVSVGNPLGHPDRPMQRSEIAEKFQRLSEPVFGEKRSKKALAQLLKIRDEIDVSILMETMHVN